MITLANFSDTLESMTPSFSTRNLDQSTIDTNGQIIRDRDLCRRDDSGTSNGKSEGRNDSVAREIRLISPLIRLPPGSLPKERVEVLQCWEGVITQVTADSFFAELQDLTCSTSPLEIVELPIEEISKDDCPLLVEGAIFYWSIGYETSPGGQTYRISEIRMQRMPRWSKRTEKLVQSRAQELFELHAKE